VLPVFTDIETSHLHLESQGELCSLCGEQKRRFEPTVLYCQGKCGMQRIKRNASYYTDRTKQNHWCESCFAEMKANEPIHLDDETEVMKKDLQVFKNDALPEEGWVNCDDCESWVHQICALFNGRTNKSTARYTCPSCFVRMPRTEEVRKASEAVKGAKDLARCKMSDAIEEGMKSALEAAYRERAGELGVTVDQVEKAEDLSVRVIANVDKKHLVGDLVSHIQNRISVRHRDVALIISLRLLFLDVAKVLCGKMPQRVSCPDEVHCTFSENPWCGYFSLRDVCL
jgi:E1A/CREB-binding protein